MNRRFRPRQSKAAVFLVTKAGRAGQHVRPWTPRSRKTPVTAHTVLGEPTPTAATCGTESSQ